METVTRDLFDPQTGLLFALIAALWASTSAQVAGYKAVNEKRDAIILGAIGDKPLSLEHRRNLLWNDWLPLKLGLGVVSLSFTLIVLVSPFILPKNQRSIFAWVLVFIIAAMPLLAAFSWLVLGYFDWRLLRKVLADAEQNTKDMERSRAATEPVQN